MNSDPVSMSGRPIRPEDERSDGIPPPDAPHDHPDPADDHWDFDESLTEALPASFDESFADPLPASFDESLTEALPASFSESFADPLPESFSESFPDAFPTVDHFPPGEAPDADPASVAAEPRSRRSLWSRIPTTVKVIVPTCMLLALGGAGLAQVVLSDGAPTTAITYAKAPADLAEEPATTPTHGDEASTPAVPPSPSDPTDPSDPVDPETTDPETTDPTQTPSTTTARPTPTHSRRTTEAPHPADVPDPPARPTARPPAPPAPPRPRPPAPPRPAPAPAPTARPSTPVPLPPWVPKPRVTPTTTPRPTSTTSPRPSPTETSEPSPENRRD
ncbi:hypothetical protein [Arsenicicoccus dermatophilus]|uniref:hypothetical protein n=1 Tax=Arsenicicoccus dermatophilus TaxID=1076331 RepID=UPI001F4D05D7|nr:hypothetical protein [Arsenicicoccus dermatophilus]MCH8611487.1 hypothetical protein [Arsenicicoccus dermatophilus]